MSPVRKRRCRAARCSREPMAAWRSPVERDGSPTLNAISCKVQKTTQYGDKEFHLQWKSKVISLHILSKWWQSQGLTHGAGFSVVTLNAPPYSSHSLTSRWPLETPAPREKSAASTTKTDLTGDSHCFSIFDVFNTNDLEVVAVDRTASPWRPGSVQVKQPLFVGSFCFVRLELAVTARWRAIGCEWRSAREKGDNSCLQLFDHLHGNGRRSSNFRKCLLWDVAWDF